MKNKKGNLINQEIKANKVRLIAEDGTQLGIVSLKEALDKAHQLGLDLVELNANKDESVCKIMNYSKYLYTQQKKQKENLQHQKQMALKEIRISPTIDVGDYNTKLNQSKKFLQKGHKIQFTLRFRGRMINHSEMGKAIFDRLLQDLGTDIIVEQKPKLEGRKMFMVVSPNKKA